MHGTFATVDQGARPGRRDGLRRGLPAADPPDRHGAPQGPEQQRCPAATRRRARRRRLAVGDRLGRGRARRDRTPSSARSRTSTRSSPAPATSAWRSRSTSRCSAPRTTRGSPRTRSGSPCAPTGRSPTRRTRRRSTRTSTRSTSTTTPPASTPSRCGSCCYWVEHGVRIFRVDNPHTKPPNFWHWLIWQVKAKYPDVLFLAEAFTRPARLFGLARLGLHASRYTYFTWRTGKRGAHRVRPRCTPSAPTSAGPTCSSTPRTSSTSRCRPAARRCSRSAPRWPRRCRRPGASTPASSSSSDEPVQPGQRGVPRLREVPAAPARLRRRAGRGPLAGAVAHPAQRDPPRAPGAAAAARHPLPPHRQRRAARLLEDATRHRRHRAGGVHARPVQRPATATSPSTCRRSASTGTTPSSRTTRSAARPSTGASSRTCGSSRGTPSRTSSR